MKKIMQLIGVFATVLGLATSAIAGPKPTAKFTVDAAQSKIEWKAKKVTGSHNGTVNIAKGELSVDGINVKSGSFDIDMNSIAVVDVTDANMNGKLLGHLKSDDFFSVTNFPGAHFELTSIAGGKGGNVTLNGKLTIKGITNDISFPADVKITGKSMKATATITIDRTKFNIRYRSTNFFENLGDKAIYDDFTLEVVLVANAG